MHNEGRQETGTSTYPPCKVPLTAAVPEGVELGVPVPTEVGAAVLEPACSTLEGAGVVRLSDAVPVDGGIVVV